MKDKTGMEGGKRVTSIMIAVAMLTLAALAVSTGWKTSRNGGPDTVQDQTTEILLLPGLDENLTSVAKFTGYPRANIRSVIITRANDEELTVLRDRPGDYNFEFGAGAPADTTAFSAILFANAAFLNSLENADNFVVANIVEEHIAGRLKYTSYDGLVLELIVFNAADDSTWMRIVAAYAPKLASRFEPEPLPGLQAAQEIITIARRLNGRVYKFTPAN